MALIMCKECGEEISDKASVCPKCGYPMKYPVPNYSDITHSYDIDLNDTYYDEKNKRYISEYEYLEAKERSNNELIQAAEACYQRTQELRAYVNNPNELEEVKIIRFYLTLINENLSSKYSEEGLNIMRNYIKKYKERTKGKKLKKEKKKKL